LHEYDLIIAPLISLVCIAIGLIVYLYDSKSSAGKVFAVISCSIGVWILGAFLSDIRSIDQYSLFFNRLVFVALFFLMGGLLYLPFVFPNRSKFATYIKWPLVIFSVFFGIFALVTPYIVAKIEFEDWGSNLTYGNYFMIFTVFAFAAIIISLVKFIINYLRSKPEERTKLRLFFEGLFLFMLITIIVHVVIRNIVGSDEFYRFGNYAAVIFVAFTAYAIVKHQLFNIKVILTEIAVAVVSGSLFVEIFLSKTPLEWGTSILLWIIATYGGYLLIKSVIREIKFREELQVMAEQLGHANAHLKELDQMKTEFVSLASHELLTPVSAIEGYLSMLLDEHMAKVEDPKAVKYLTNVYSSAKRLARLIADMLNISRIEEGRLLVEKKDINLSELVLQAIDEIHFKADEKKQRIVFENDEIRMTKSELNKNDQNQKFETYGDADKIKEVVINLIGNSIKYSKDPGTISVHIEKVPTPWVQEKWQKIEEDIKSRPLDDQEAIHSAVDEHFRNFVGSTQLMIAVKDQGIGIPKEELPRLFKKFHRVGDYTTAESQGTGLGLYISRALVELHHGRIWADSEGPGKGSTFTFTLPDISDKEELLKMEAQAPKKESLKPLAKPTKAAEDI